jgi:hypothetical protein
LIVVASAFVLVLLFLSALVELFVFSSISF